MSFSDVYCTLDVNPPELKSLKMWEWLGIAGLPTLGEDAVVSALPLLFRIGDFLPCSIVTGFDLEEPTGVPMVAFVNVYEIPAVGCWYELELEPEVELELELDEALAVCVAATAATRDDRRLRLERSSTLAVIWMVCGVVVDRWDSDALFGSALLDELLLFEFELFAGPCDMERVATDWGSDFVGNAFFDELLDGVLFLEPSAFDPLATPDVRCPMRVSTLEADLLDEPPLLLPCFELT